MLHSRINDLPTHSVIPSKKSNCSGYQIFSSHLFFPWEKYKPKASNCFRKRISLQQ